MAKMTLDQRIEKVKKSIQKEEEIIALSSAVEDTVLHGQN